MSRAYRTRRSRYHRPCKSKRARPWIETLGRLSQIALNEVGQRTDGERVGITYRCDQMGKKHAYIKGLLQEKREFSDFQGVDVIVIDQGRVGRSCRARVPLWAHLIEDL